MPTQPAFLLDSVTKVFGGTRVLSGVSLSVEAGQCVVILGPSGSGKSVLMRLLLGFLTPDEGRVRFFGGLPPFSPFQNSSPDRHRLGVLFQSDALIEDLTIEENLALGARAYDPAADSQEILQIAKTLLERVGINWDEKRAARPSQLSGGMRKRVALARALACKPEALLVDEPTSGLDVRSSRQIIDLLREEIHRNGLTSIIITHDLFLAKELATRLLQLDPSTRTLSEIDIATFAPDQLMGDMDEAESIKPSAAPLESSSILKKAAIRMRNTLESIGIGAAIVARAFPFPAIHEFLRRFREALLASLPLIGSIFLLIGMILYVQTRAALAPMALFNLMPAALAEAGLKLTPPFLGLVMAGRLGSVICAEAGLLRQTGQLDAMRVLGMSPERHLLAPSLWAAIAAMPILAILSEAATLGGALLMLLVPGQGARIGALKLAQSILSEADVALFVLGLCKAMMFGVVIVLCGYFFGTREQSGTSDLGRSITGAIVASFLTIIALDFLASLATVGI